MLAIDQEKSLNICALNEGKNIATSVCLKIVTKDILPEVSQLENVFLHQFNGHVVRNGTHLILKHLGKKWLVVVEKVIRRGDGTDDDLSAVMESLTMDAPPQPHLYLLILSTTKISFDAPGETISKESSLAQLSDFGGSHEVVQEITKLCNGVFQTPITSKSNVISLLSLKIFL